MSVVLDACLLRLSSQAPSQQPHTQDTDATNTSKSIATDTPGCHGDVFAIAGPELQTCVPASPQTVSSWLAARAVHAASKIVKALPFFARAR